MAPRGKGVIAARAAERKAALRTDVLERHPSLLSPIANPADLLLGQDERGRAVSIPAKVRLQGCHLVGSTGSGKTKLIEHAIRQDILAGRGVCLIDPHGGHPDSCYRSVLSWMSSEGLLQSHTVHLVDPNVETHVTGFNPLAMPDAGYDPAVIADAVLEAIEKLWGEDTKNKPTLQRVLSAAVTALCELRLTLNELRFLFDDPDDRYGVRAWIIGQLRNEVARGELRWLDGIAKEPRGRSEFRLEVTGPRNRFAKLLNLDSLALTVGQLEGGLDFRAALDQSHVILVNLAPGPRLSDKAAQMLGRLLLRMLFFHAQRRNKTDVPFYLFCDEAHLFMSSDVARFLSEIRKYGVGCVWSHQHLAQLQQADFDLLDAVKANTNIKVVFRSRDPEQAAELAEMVVPLDLERPVEALVKPAVIGHRIRRLHGDTESEQFSTTLSRGSTYGQSRAIGVSHSRTTTNSQTLSQGYSIGQGASWSDGRSASRGQSAGISDSATDANGASSGTNETESYAPPPETLFGPGEPGLRGTTKGKSAQSNRSTAQAHAVNTSESSARSASSMRGASWNVSRNFSRSRGSAESVGRTDSVSRATNQSSSVSVGRTSGTSSGSSSQEALEPIYRDLPSAVHSIENVRYLAARAVRNLPTGRAIISFVDSNGLQSSFLQVPHVENCALPPERFSEIRTQVLQTSPSAIPTEEARKHIAQHAEKLIAAAREEQPEEPSSYRNKRKRAVQDSVDLHDERSAPECKPVKGRDRQRRRPDGRP
jgi:hypothetical protein